MDKFENKVLKLNLDSKRNVNNNSKHLGGSKNDNNNVFSKNNQITELSDKNYRIGDLISVEKLDLNENGVSKNQMNMTNSSLLEYLKVSIETLQIQNERMETMIDHQSELLDNLNKENFDLSENYSYFKELIETNILGMNSEMAVVDEKIKMVDDEIKQIEKLNNQEEEEILNEISKEIEKMVEKSQEKNVNNRY